jgi:hypothetical protein
MNAVTFVDVETGEIMGRVGHKAPLQEILDALSDENFKFTLTGLEVVGKPTFPHCERKYIELSELKRLTPIWLGDMLNYMEKVYGDKYAQVLDPTGYSYQTAANQKSVMGKVSPEVRQPGLTFTHYRIASPFERSEQRKLLKKAKDENLNTTAFNHLARIEKRKAEHGTLPPKVKLQMTATFEVPADLKAKMRDLAEGWANRLWEWDIECRELSIRENNDE